MFSIARSAALFALLAAVAPALAQVSVADVPYPDSMTCPVPANGNVNANVLAVVHFDETARADVAGLLGGEVPVTLDVCLCLTAAAALGTVDLPVDLQDGVDAATSAYIQANPSLAANVALLADELTATGAILDVTVAPSNNIDPCNCPITSIPGCTDGGCTCRPCSAGKIYSPTRGICVLAPSAGAGGAARMARARRADSSIVAGRQAKRSDIVAHMA